MRMRKPYVRCWPKRMAFLEMVVALLLPAASMPEGLLGCTFLPGLCSRRETCFDDNVFGRCITLDEALNPVNLAFSDSEKSQLMKLLSKEIVKLRKQGYSWRDEYTQCALDSIMQVFKARTIFEVNNCEAEAATAEKSKLEKGANNFYRKIGNPRKHQGSERQEKSKYNKPNSERHGRPFNIRERSNFVDKSALSNFMQDGEDEIIVSEGKEFDPDYDWEFPRLVRLDVKKPGPFIGYRYKSFPISANTPLGIDRFRHFDQYGDYGIDYKLVDKLLSRTLSEDWNEEDATEKNDIETTSKLTSQTTMYIKKDENNEVPHFLLINNSQNDSTKDMESRRVDLSSYEMIDISYVYVDLLSKFSSAYDAVKFVGYLEKLFALPKGTFSNIRVEDSRVVFKVNPNAKGYTATSVAMHIDSDKQRIFSEKGLHIASTGIGDKMHFNSLSLTANGFNSKFYNVGLGLFGAVTAAVIAALVIFIVRRRGKAKQQLENLKLRHESDTSKDYQELCRSRMSRKAQECAESTVVHKIIKETEGKTSSPHSSHSSTSSWNEEPIVSNMDISTGHIVLAYMEDHIRNRDRLEREWLALCAYEAEPCSTEIATKEENVKKNRYVDVLPYDHSRVILNKDINQSHSDYINASNITDHDPRNPAYIATQGPLPNTVADFWQMVWEQGAVVIVMLTKLFENSVSMCCRYWPEDGSQAYFIYEVHLVSEHIWCDEYLVRSFYLKNQRTGETRTVSQFHFLRWPSEGVPASIKALLEFRRKVNKSYRGRSCPIIVHCNDGAGRTGTYCLLDMVLNKMAKGAKEIDIAATLEHIRDQRPKMVQNRQQFESVLIAIAEEVHAILKTTQK